MCFQNKFSFYYSLLDRCVSDCKYFLGNGNRCEKHLYGKSVKVHIAIMKDIYYKLPQKPEWLTMEEINEYEKQMA